MNFTSPKFEDAVAQFKRDFSADAKLYLYGQFYMTGRLTDELKVSIGMELDANPRMVFYPAVKTEIQACLNDQLNKPIKQVDLTEIEQCLRNNEAGGDLAAIRVLFPKGPPSNQDVDTAKINFARVWDDQIHGPLLLAAYPTFNKILAADHLEANACFKVAESMGRKRTTNRNISRPPPGARVSASAIAGATVKDAPGGAGSGVVVQQQTIIYSSPKVLAETVSRIRAAIDAGAVAQCGVLSGARLDKSVFAQPEHYILLFAYDSIEGRDAFLFWDPDANVTRLRSTVWGRGFGCVFSTRTRFSTAIDEADLAAIDRNKNSLTFGDHLADAGEVPGSTTHERFRRHCYQIYFVQTIPK